MKSLLGNLIIVSPASATIRKFRYTPKAIVTIGVACLMCFGVVVALCAVPKLVTDLEQESLETENQQLKVTNRNQQLKVETIDSELSNLEAQSERIKELIDTE